MNERVVGYILLVVGIVLILGAGVATVMVFTKQMAPPQLFSGPGISLDPGQLTASLAPSTGEKLSLPKQELVSGELLNQTSNLFAFVFLAGFVASVGYKLASLGVLLVRPIVVKVKEKDGKEYQVTDQGKT